MKVKVTNVVSSLTLKKVPCGRMFRSLTSKEFYVRTCRAPEGHNGVVVRECLRMATGQVMPYDENMEVQLVQEPLEVTLECPFD